MLPIILGIACWPIRHASLTKPSEESLLALEDFLLELAVSHQLREKAVRLAVQTSEPQIGCLGALPAQRKYLPDEVLDASDFNIDYRHGLSTREARSYHCAQGAPRSQVAVCVVPKSRKQCGSA